MITHLTSLRDALPTYMLPSLVMGVREYDVPIAVQEEAAPIEAVRNASNLFAWFLEDEPDGRTERCARNGAHGFAVR